ncbi:insulinase family protein [Bacteroidales bacterium OttesenSCG-928-K03]|nr:insulinase family protein [Bacteroidales bacterium OttesenSCG-928-K22]MDL2242399.1 insulinase family protein [Bacteroidales bacterium OttesenSCG-928-K03]
MKPIKFLTFAIVALVFASCSTKSAYEVKTAVDSNGYTYEYVTNDPTQSRIYTLDNGLTVYLSRNEVEPRVSTLIGVKAGSTSEDPNSTGLAHYFEHMMFKGTSHLGTTDWEKESALLDQISELFEIRRNSKDPAEQALLYKQIDSLSVLAAGYAIPSEYDKMVASLGASNTNAGTSYEMTVYINEIPTNEMEKWMMVELDRFQNIQLRLFHTELETVYEEFNMYQDMDDSRLSNAMMKAIFPTHPYGRDVIGFPEHLKLPSMKDIVTFHQTYYVPNNMAVALSGDINLDETIKLVNKHFGQMERKELPKHEPIKEEPINEPIEVEVFGPEAESITIMYRFENSGDNDLMISAINKILYNGKCGLIDLNLNQQQKVLEAYSYDWSLKDYATHSFMAQPRDGQTLEELKDLLFEQLDKIRKGDFEDWILEASLNNARYSKMMQDEYNMSRTYRFIGNFIMEKDYVDIFKDDERFANITKQQIMDFVNKNYKNNYVIGYKRIGEPSGVVRVEKPEISTIPINRDAQSDYFIEISNIEVEDIQPLFIDYKNSIHSENILSGLDFHYIKNTTNGIFKLYYIFEAGKFNDLKLPIAIDYLQYLGTDKYSAEELQQELYKLALRFSVVPGNEMSYVYISGMEDKFDEAIELLDHVLNNAQVDVEAYNNYIDGLLKKRENDKIDPSNILWRAMRTFGMYGAKNPATHILSEAELKNIDPNELVDIIKNLKDYEHLVFYYGSAEQNEILKDIKAKHNVNSTLKKFPEEVKFEKLNVTKNEIYFVDYQMVQSNLLMVTRGNKFDVADMPYITVFGEYYGGGLSSIVFQEIREARSLAYSSMASINNPSKKDDFSSITCFVGTQADKLKTAADAMTDLMNKMPLSETQYELSKDAIIKRINTQRIVKDNIFFQWLNLKDLGIDYDYRKDTYEKVQNMSIKEFETFFNDYVSGKSYKYMIIGDRSTINFKELEKYGQVQELQLEEIFGY